MMVLLITATTPTAWYQGTLAIVFVPFWVTVVSSLENSGNRRAANSGVRPFDNDLGLGVKVRIQIPLVFLNHIN